MARWSVVLENPHLNLNPAAAFQLQFLPFAVASTMRYHQGVGQLVEEAQVGASAELAPVLVLGQ